jgi:hypothetical protein
VHPINHQIADRLEEAARLLHDQGADRFRISAYLKAAEAIRSAPEQIDETHRSRGVAGLKEIRGVGESIARAVREMLMHGRFPLLDRLRGESNPIALLASVPGVGRILAERLHEELGLETLADVEAAAHDGRLAAMAGFGQKRLASIRDSLAHRLGRVSLLTLSGASPSVSELLDVDREYREKAGRGQLLRITPRRCNPMRQAWLPILHTRRGTRHYTALFSNTARAHQVGKTRDWVVLYGDNGSGDTRHTVITATFGPLRGLRVVAGRENECQVFYAGGRRVRWAHRPGLAGAPQLRDHAV